jgi:RimJ/RimL family protein N-acetyltransferase
MTNLQFQTPLRLQTPRLELVAATPDTLRADLVGRKQLAEALNVDVPDAWPPINWEREPIEYLIDWMQKRPDAPGWFAWYCLLPSPSGRGVGSEGCAQARCHKQHTLIGGLGFLGPPNTLGETAVGYSLLSTYHRQGYCPEALAALLDWAFAHADLKTLVVRTIRNHRPSIRVAERLRFEFAGPGPEPDTVEYVLCRDVWNRSNI